MLPVPGGTGAHQAEERPRGLHRLRARGAEGTGAPGEDKKGVRKPELLPLSALHRPRCWGPGVPVPGAGVSPGSSPEQRPPAPGHGSALLCAAPCPVPVPGRDGPGCPLISRGSAGGGTGRPAHPPPHSDRVQDRHRDRHRDQQRHRLRDRHRRAQRGAAAGALRAGGSRGPGPGLGLCLPGPEPRGRTAAAALSAPHRGREGAAAPPAPPPSPPQPQLPVAGPGGPRGLAPLHSTARSRCWDPPEHPLGAPPSAPRARLAAPRGGRMAPGCHREGSRCRELAGGRCGRWRVGSTKRGRALLPAAAGPKKPSPGAAGAAARGDASELAAPPPTPSPDLGAQPSLGRSIPAGSPPRIPRQGLRVWFQRGAGALGFEGGAGVTLASRTPLRAALGLPGLSCGLGACVCPS